MPVLADLARLVGMAVYALRRAARMALEGVESRPGARPNGLGRPVVHEGATETFGAELRALRGIEVSPELVSDIETELHWGLIWHDFERTMQAQIDRVFAPYLAIAECLDFDDLRDWIGLPEPATA
jgi:hypothetical protein